MIPSNSGPRRQPFRVGDAYTAKKSFGAAPDGEFVAGKQYVFLGDHYSWRDSDTTMVFHELGDDKRHLTWFWHDDDADDVCEGRFEIHPY